MKEGFKQKKRNAMEFGKEFFHWPLNPESLGKKCTNKGIVPLFKTKQKRRN